MKKINNSHIFSDINSPQRNPYNVNQSVEQKTKRPRKLLGRIIIFLFLLLLIISIFSFFYVRAQLFSPVSSDSSEKIFEIKEGQGVLEIVDSLQKEGFLGNKWVILGYLKLKGTGKNLKAGVYLLKKDQRPVDILEEIFSGKTALKKVTILEGWNTKEIADYLDKRGLVGKQNFLDTLKRENWKYDFLENSQSLEGFLFPDTYYISYNASSEEIIKKMLDNFDKKLTPSLKEEIKKQGKSLSEIITLASIVEKEVLKEEDKKIVAGIFWKRISLGMPLEADSTVNYITGKNSSAPTIADTKVNSLYNTYLNKGLPPTPISNPSLPSILAAIYPTDSPYLFFINRQDTKETIFSKTYEEHLANKEKYLK